MTIVKIGDKQCELSRLILTSLKGITIEIPAKKMVISVGETAFVDNDKAAENEKLKYIIVTPRGDEFVILASPYGIDALGEYETYTVKMVSKMVLKTIFGNYEWVNPNPPRQPREGNNSRYNNSQPTNRRNENGYSERTNQRTGYSDQRSDQRGQQNRDGYGQGGPVRNNTPRGDYQGGGGYRSGSQR